MLLYETSDFSAKIDAISLWQRKKYSKSRKMICFTCRCIFMKLFIVKNLFTIIYNTEP